MSLDTYGMDCVLTLQFYFLQISTYRFALILKKMALLVWLRVGCSKHNMDINYTMFIDLCQVSHMSSLVFYVAMILCMSISS